MLVLVVEFEVVVEKGEGGSRMPIFVMGAGCLFVFLFFCRGCGGREGGKRERFWRGVEKGRERGNDGDG